MSGPVLDAPPAWMARGTCWTERVPVDVFFPTEGADVPLAQHYCVRCPVRRACLEYALDNHEIHGVWGGESERDRVRILRARRRRQGAMAS